MKFPRSKARGLARHQIVILAVGLPALFIGSGSIIAYKFSHNAYHFKSTHAVRPRCAALGVLTRPQILGLIIFIWMVRAVCCLPGPLC